MTWVIQEPPELPAPLGELSEAREVCRDAHLPGQPALELLVIAAVVGLFWGVVVALAVMAWA